MMPNVYKSKLDIKNVKSDFRPTFIQYDHAILEIELLDNGFPYNLSTAHRVEFTHVREDGLVIIHEGVIVTNGSDKIISYEYQGSEMDLIGTIKTSFAIFDIEDKKVSSHAFDVAVVRDLRNEIFSPAEPNFGLLQTLLADVRNIKENGGGGSGGFGPQGPPGRDGIDGIDGYTPVKGIDYNDGKDGEKGEPFTFSDFTAAQLEALRGPRGADGQNGADGKAFTFEDFTSAQLATLKGERGERGLPGEPGYTPQKNIDYFDGVAGQDGIDGVDGKSAYQIAVSNGFSGTEAEWLTSLKGPQGPPGSDASVTSANITTALGYTPIKASDITWANVLAKPTTFTPSAHTHDWADISNKPATFSPSSHSHAWTEITGKPTTFTPTTHSHSYNDLTNKPNIPTLNNTVTSTSTTEAATARAVKEAYDLASAKAPLASPTFTGTPTAPTAISGTNTTQVATTAFVKVANDTHKTDAAPHQYGGKFEWRYNPTTNSLDLVVLP